MVAVVVADVDLGLPGHTARAAVDLPQRLVQLVNDNGEGVSPGEMQMLAFIRMFYHSPSIAILDEATSSVSLDVEEMLYSECLRRQMTFISVAHRDTVEKFHHQNLILSLLTNQ